MCVSCLSYFVAQSTRCQSEAAALPPTSSSEHTVALSCTVAPRYLPHFYSVNSIHVLLPHPSAVALPSSDEALWLAAVAAGDPFVRRANPTPGAIVLHTTAPNGDAAPPTPAGQALTSARPHPTVIPRSWKAALSRRLTLAV